MKRIYLFVITVLLFTFSLNAQEKNHDHKDQKMEKHSIVREGEIDLMAIDKNKDGKVFQDPMDWNVISDEAGRCPLCEMKLKEVTLEEAKANLLKHGHKVKVHHMEMKGEMKKMDDKKHDMKKMDHKEHKKKEKKTASADIWNTHCPVMGGEVDPTVQTVKYKSKTIAFCCPGCEDKLKADPEKYLSSLDENGIKIEK